MILWFYDSMYDQVLKHHSTYLCAIKFLFKDKSLKYVNVIVVQFDCWILFVFLWIQIEFWKYPIFLMIIFIKENKKEECQRMI